MRNEIVYLLRLLFSKVIDNLYLMKLSLGWGNPLDEFAGWVRISIRVKIPVGGVHSVELFIK